MSPHRFLISSKRKMRNYRVEKPNNTLIEITLIGVNITDETRWLSCPSEVMTHKEGFVSTMFWPRVHNLNLIIRKREKTSKNEHKEWCSFKNPHVMKDRKKRERWDS